MIFWAENSTPDSINALSQNGADENFQKESRRRIGYVYHPDLVAAANLLPSNIQRVCFFDPV
jgi:hypothetical protein